MKIYTKKGDQGHTSLLGGTKVSKSHLRIEAYGMVDELNAHIGLVWAYFEDIQVRANLHQIQSVLFTLGSHLACDNPTAQKMLPTFNEGWLAFLEQEIDQMQDKLPELKNFILPTGSALISQVHVARCVCRRAERAMVTLHENEPIELLMIQYINRLSDYLFVLARYAAKQEQKSEVIWKA